MLVAARARLIHQVLTEIAILVVAGGGAGLAVATALVRALTASGPIALPRITEVTVDGPVTAFSIALMLLTMLLFGLWPSRHAARSGVATPVRAAMRTIAGGRLRHRARRALIVAEVSLSLVLLIGATLLLVSLRRLQQVDPGFNADGLFTTMVIRYRPDGRETFVQRLVDQVSALPGVRAAAATSSLPLAPGRWSKYFTADDRPAPGSMAEVPTVSYYHVTNHVAARLCSRATCARLMRTSLCQTELIGSRAARRWRRAIRRQPAEPPKKLPRRAGLQARHVPRGPAGLKTRPTALLRIVLREAGALDELKAYDALLSSEPIAVESARTIDRRRLPGSLTGAEAAISMRAATQWLEAIDLEPPAWSLPRSPSRPTPSSPCA